MDNLHLTLNSSTALRILGGEAIEQIPFVTNKEGRLVINLRLGNKLKITFKSALLRIAEIIR